MTRCFWTQAAAAAMLTASMAAGVRAATTTPAAPPFYRQTNLISDVPGLAPVVDPALVNPWGMSYSAASPFWISNAGSNTSTVYSVDPATGAASKVALTVSVPGAPTGQVQNGTPDFIVSQGTASGAAGFVFVGMDGSVSAWNPKVPASAATSTQAFVVANGAAGSSYTGMAMGTRGADPFLYVANNGLGRIDVFDKSFKAATVPGGFIDKNLPAGDRPYNVANLNGSLYVAYNGPTAVVNVFDTDGALVRRLATGGTLRNPWGMALAPADFGPFSNAVLVGNFNFGNPAAGPGVISAFDPTSGRFLGLLNDAEGNPIWIDGLWALGFGNGAKAGAKNVLYFTAGIQNQQHGLFGSIAAGS